MLDHSQQRWTISGAEFSINIACPRYFAALLSETLTGWSIKLSSHSLKPELIIARQDDGYVVDALVLSNPERHASVVGTLNEFYVNFAYLLAARTPKAVLLHCAAYQENMRNIILVGEKNSGKSSTVFQHAINGKCILADDLLLWRTDTAEFITLGLPIRLRRPIVNPTNFDVSGKAFFANNGLAYSRVGTFNVAPVGVRFLLDELRHLSANYTSEVVNLRSIINTLRSHLIGQDFATIKKEEIS